MGRSERATIRDVAERSAVSVTTVSHVLNEVPGKRVSSMTRARVLKVAEELSYRPNRMAQGLRTQRSGMIGFLSDDVSTTPYSGRMIIGSQDAALAAGSLMVLLNSSNDRELEQREIEALLQRGVDGVIYATGYHRVVNPPEQLRMTPTVLLDASNPNGLFSSVVPDEVGGSRKAVEELLAAGHRRIGFTNNQEDIPARRLRLVGYRQALEVYGLTLDERLMIDEDPTARGGYAATKALLDRPERPTGIFCATDRMAMGAYQACQELGLTIPGDVSIVGFDDQELVADSLRPGLTTVALPHYEMGRWAMERLLKQIAEPGASPSQALLDCPLIRRGSVEAPSGEQKFLATPIPEGSPSATALTAARSRSEDGQGA
jgi:LacI family transcriptional regulator